MRNLYFHGFHIVKFVLHSTTRGLMVGRTVNNELERMWKEAAVVQYEVLC
jgi:hypothetical protein